MSTGRGTGKGPVAAYVGRRLLQAVGVLWAAFTLSYLILYLLPSDPVSIMLDAASGNGYVDPAKAAELRAAYGFDKGPVEQYLTMLGRALTGDLGTSVSSGAEVTTLVAQAFPETLRLASFALVLSILAGAGIATASVWTRSPRLRHLLLSLPPVGVSVPTFWMGLILLQVFSFQLYWFPAVGNEGFASLVLPAVTLAVPLSAVVAQVLAESMQSAWRTQYVETALAKGASRSRVLVGHVARNATIPALTILGVLVGNLLAGSVVVETVFSRAGLGRLVQTSVQAQDIPVVQGLVVVAALVFVVVNLVVDLAYPLLDPRITRPARLARGPRQAQPRPTQPVTTSTHSTATA